MYRRNTQGWIKHLDFIMLDLVCLHISFLLAFLVRHGLRNPYADEAYFGMILFLTLADVLISILFSTFKNVLKRGYYNEFTVTLRQVCLVILVTAFYLFAVKDGESISRTVIYLMGICYFFFSYVTRLLWKRYLRRKLSGARRRSLLIVTTPDRAPEAVHQIKKFSYDMFRIAAVVVVGGGETPGSIEGVPVLAEGKDTAEYLCREWVDEALITVPESVPAPGKKQVYPQRLVEQLMEMGVVVHISLEENFNPLGQKQFVERIGKYTVLTSSMNCAGSVQLFLKRAMDILLGAVGCLVTLLLTAVIGPMIYLKSPGPIFFAQTRVGRNGRKFRMYKFRSMYPDAEERKAELMKDNRMEDGRMFKLDYDPRIIGCTRRPDGSVKKGIGNFIRDWSLDEFPQFYNVLKGEMSLVGTRPPTEDEWERYLLHHRARLSFKPGLTGLWQISGRSNITSFEEVVKLDAEYIANWNLGTDVKILLKTVGVVMRRDGAR